MHPVTLIDPIFALHNMVVTGITREFVDDSFLVIHIILAGFKILVFLCRRKVLKKLMEDSKILQAKGESFEDQIFHFSQYKNFIASLSFFSILDDPEVARNWDRVKTPQYKSQPNNSRHYYFKILVLWVN